MDNYTLIKELKKIVKMYFVLKGGEGSGNFGHEGRPGEIGGSQEGGGSSEGSSTKVGKHTFDKYPEKVGSGVKINDKEYVLTKGSFANKDNDKVQFVLKSALADGSFDPKKDLIELNAKEFNDAFEKNGQE